MSKLSVMAIAPSASYSFTVRLDEMNIAAAHAIASCVDRREFGPEYIIPNVFDKEVAPAGARGVAKAAQRTGVARRRPRTDSAFWW